MLRILKNFDRIFRLGLILFFVIGLLSSPGTAVQAQTQEPPSGQEPSDPLEVANGLEEATVEMPVDPSASEPDEFATQTVEIPETGDMPNSAEEVTLPENQFADDSLTPKSSEILQNPEQLPVEDVLPEVVEQLADNGLVLVDEEGDELPLAAEQVVEILANADPYFTEGSITYGWTNAGSRDAPICQSAVTAGFCTFSDNPINDAIASILYNGQKLTIENGDYHSNDVVINKPVNLSPAANLTVNTIRLENGAVVNWSPSGITQYNLTSANVTILPGAYLQDAVELVSAGGTIHMEAGVFDDDAGVDINKPVTLQGVSATETVVRPSTACGSEPGSRCQQYFLVNADQVKIHNLTLEGKNGDTPTRLITGLKSSGHAGLEVSNSTFRDLFSNGILISGDASTYFIHDNQFMHIHAQLSSSDGSGVKITQDRGDAADQRIMDNAFTDVNRGVFLEDGDMMLVGNDFFANMFGIMINDLDPGDDVAIQKNRFFGNTTRGILYTPSGPNDPVVNAGLNWWGCNAGPNATGCDSAFSSRTGKIDTTSILQLGVQAAPAAINTNGSTSLSTFLFSSTDSTRSPVDGIGWFHPMSGLRLTGENLGTLIGGIFTGILPGTQTISASLDNATMNAQVQINPLTCAAGQSNVGGTCRWDDCPHTGMQQDAQTGLCSWPACPQEGMVQDGNTGLCGWPACPESGMNQDPFTGQCAWPACPHSGMLQDPGSGNCAWPACPHAGMIQDSETGSCGWKACEHNGMDQNPETGECSWQSCPHAGMIQDGDLGTCAWPTCPYGGMIQDSDTGSCAWAPCPAADMLQDSSTGVCTWPACPFQNQTQNSQTGQCAFTDVCAPGQTRSLLTGVCEYSDTCSAVQKRNLTSGTCEAIVCDDGLPTTENILNPDGTCSYQVKNCDNVKPETLDTLNADGSCSHFLIVPVKPSQKPISGVGINTSGNNQEGEDLIPSTGGLTDLDADNPVVLVTTGGSMVRFSDPLGGFQAGLDEMDVSSLPAPLPEGLTFGSGLNLTLQRDATGFPLLPGPVSYTLSFVVPPELVGKTLVVLYWEASANGGLGGWMELPLNLDGEEQLSGDRKAVIHADGTVSLNFTGTFVLAAR